MAYTVTSHALFHLLSTVISEKHRTLGNATVWRLNTFCALTHSVMMSLTKRLILETQCNVGLLLAAGIYPSRENKEGGKKGLLCH